MIKLPVQYSATGYKLGIIVADQFGLVADVNKKIDVELLHGIKGVAHAVRGWDTYTICNVNGVNYGKAA